MPNERKQVNDLININVSEVKFLFWIETINAPEIFLM